jgi:uncharacterized protein YcnI
VATLGFVALAAAGPAAAHVTGTPSVATAGSFTVLTLSVPHGCEGSPTTKVEIQIPEQVMSVTPTRNPFYQLDFVIEQLDEPVTDAHGNDMTERVASIVYTAKTPLPEGERDTFELSFQIPEAPGELLAFPTIQTCEQGRTGWIEVPQEGQSEEELENPAPAFEILPADEGDGGGHDDAAAEGTGDDASDASQSGADDSDTQEASAEDGSMVGWVALVLGGLGLLAGGVALARTRTSA